jgi:predicted O-methyltransferase YrrM
MNKEYPSHTPHPPHPHPLPSTDYLFTVDWFSPHILLWGNYLNHYKGKPNLRFLEIGSYQGRAAVWLLENILTHNSSSITCIDTFEGSVEHHEHFKDDIKNLFETFSHNMSRFGDKVKVMKNRSQVALKHLSICGANLNKGDDGQFDFVYIDGDHRASSVMEDAVLSLPLLKQGGLMIFDDYLWTCSKKDIDDPKPAIDAFIHLYADKIKVLFINQQVIIRKL